MPAGRPRVITAEIKEQLKLAFTNGLNNEEACCYVGVKESTFYDFLVREPEFSELKEQLKKKPSIRAKLNVMKKLNKGDITTSKWYLEKTNRKEFGDHKSLDVNGNLSFTGLIDEIDEDENNDE